MILVMVLLQHVLAQPLLERDALLAQALEDLRLVDWVRGVEGAGLAQAPPALDLPLHPDRVLLAQRGRDLLLQAHPATPPARRVRLARRLAGGDQPLPRRDERQPQAFRLDRRPGPHHRKGAPRAPSVRTGPL